MHLIIEHLANDVVMLCNGPTVVASIQLLHPDVLISTKAPENCFVIIPGPGHFTMTSHLDRDQVLLEVNGIPRVMVNLRAANVFVTFYDEDKYAIRIL